MWPDLLHRCARRAAASLSASGATALLKKLNKLFRFSRAPFNSSRFGKTVQEHRQHLVSLLKQGQCPELTEMFLASVARDAGRDIEGFSVQDLIGLLEGKAGGVLWFSLLRCLSVPPISKPSYIID